MENNSLKNIRGYELQEAIGKGGFGAVYRALQPIVGREVAIKVILPAHANQPEFIRNFETEAKTIARLESPYIVPLYDFWREPDGAYLVMRYLRGGTLKQELAAQGAFSVDRVALILEQICSALWTAHRNKIVHRDIKPANIILDAEGNAYLSDFGLAINLDDEIAKGMVGTWLYMAPERIRNAEQTQAIDVYSLGIMLFEMLTGAYPFDRNSIERLAYYHLKTPLPDIETIRAELPSQLNMIVQRATAKDPEARYSDTRQMADEFRKLLNSSAIGSQAIISLSDSDFINPFMGLRPFSEADEDFFFGRSTLIYRLISRLKEDTMLANFLAVVGPSGSGKSSVIYAGLLPELRRGALEGSRNWFFATMVPGSQPLQNLESALLSVATVALDDMTEKLSSSDGSLSETVTMMLDKTVQENGLLLFIDQFEELFTLVESEQIRQEFLSLLTATIANPESNIRIIITLRADFYDKPLRYEEFGKLIQNRTEVILPLDSSELERAIVAPAKRVGLEVEQNLVGQVIADVRQEPGALPLLQYTLTELFNRRDGTVLTLNAYEQSGGVRGALARRADEVYLSLTSHEQAIAKQLFLRLVTLGEGSEDTRRRTRFSDLMVMGIDNTILQNLLDIFGKYRLLTFDRDVETREPTVEVAHEALIREWSRFRLWLDASRQDLRLQRLIATEVADWKASQEDSSYLLRGTRLAQLEEWTESNNLFIKPEEYAFIQASIKEREREQALEVERHAHELQLERKSRQRLQTIVILLLSASFVGIVLTGVIYVQRGTAEQERDNARIARDEAQINAHQARSLTLATSAQQAYDVGDMGLALALAQAAVEIEGSPKIATKTLADIAFAQGIRKILQTGSSERVYQVKVSPDDRYVLTVSGGSFFDFIDINDNRSPGGRPPTRTPNSGPPPPPDFSLVSPSTINIFDLESDEEFQLGSLPDYPVTSLGFIPSENDNPSTMAYSTYMDGTVLVWDIKTGDIIHNLEGGRRGYLRGSVTEDGNILLVSIGDRFDAYMENRIMLWDLRTGERIQSFVPHHAMLWDSRISGDGQIAASIYLDGTQVVWDTSTGEIIGEFTLTEPQIREPHYQVFLSKSDPIAVTSLGAGAVAIWDMDTGQLIDEVNQGQVDVAGVAIDDDAENLVIINRDGTINLWDIVDYEWLNRAEDRDVPYSAMDVNSSGTIAFVGRTDGSLVIWDLETNNPNIVEEFEDLVIGVQATLLPIQDARQLPQMLVLKSNTTSGTEIRTSMSIWDTATGQAISTWETPHHYVPNLIEVSDDGQYALTSTSAEIQSARFTGEPVQLILWDLATQEPLQIIDFENTVSGARILPFSGSDSLEVLTNWQNEVRLWDMQNAEVIRTYPAEDRIIDVELSSNGQWMIATSNSNQLIQWDFASGERIREIDLGIASRFVKAVPDSNYVVTAYGLRNLALWDLESGQLLREFIGHTGLVTSVDITSSGDFIVSGGEDANLILWDMTTGEPIDTQLWHPTRINAVDIAFDDQHYISVPQGDWLTLWRLEPITLPEVEAYIAHNRLTRDLTYEDCLQYGIAELCREEGINS